MCYPVVLWEDGNIILSLKEEMPPFNILSYLFVQGNVVVKASDSTSSAEVN